jgi:hypothetical protein
MAESSVSFGTETSGTPVRWEDHPGQHAVCDTAISGLRARAEAAEAAVAELNAQAAEAQDLAEGATERASAAEAKLRQVAAYVTGAQRHARAQFILAIIGTEGSGDV